MTLKTSLFATALLLAAVLLPQNLVAQVTVTATKDDNVPAATHKPAGSTIIYTNTVKNTGAVDATGVEFKDPDVGHTTYVTGSLTATPLARDDTYTSPVLANTSVDTSIGSGFNVLTNDFYGYVGGVALASSSAAVTVTVAAQPAHGSVAFNTGAAKGTFIYTPTAGYTGADSFTYTISNGVSGGTTPSITGTVNLTVAAAPVIWFVNTNAGTNGNGTQASPFNTLAAFQAVNDGVGLHPAANHVVFLYESGTAYTGGVTLLAGQKLIGQDATSTLSTLAGGTAPSSDIATALPAMNSANGTIVSLSNSGGSGVTLNTGNSLYGFTVGNTTASDISGTAVGTLTVADVSCIGTGAIMTISTSGALNVTLNTATSTSAGNAVALTGASGSFTANAGAISGATADSFVVNGGTANVSYGGTITGGTNGRAVNILNKTGGTVAFSGAITETQSGIQILNNSGATINFTGGLAIATTGGNNGFIISGGGTVTATQNNSTIVNTISSATGTALSVSNTTIGAAGLTFRSIAAGGGTNNGIVLDTTGSSGGLTVTGNSSAGSGGTITSKTGADGSTTSGIGVYLNSTSNVSLSLMNIQSCQNYGIRGNNVTNFSLTSSTVGTTGTNGSSNSVDSDASSYTGEGSVRFFNLLGTATVTSCTLDNGFSKTFAVSNSTGTLTNLTFSGCTLRNSLTANTSSDALYLQTQGSSTTATLTVTSGCQFTAFYQNAIDLNAQSGSTLNFNLDSSNFKNTLATPVSASNTMVINGSGSNTFVTFNIHDNTFTQGDGVSSPPINVGRILTAGSVSGTATFYGKLVNNTFGVSGVARSGGGNGADCVGLFMNGSAGSHGGSRFLVQNNIMQNYGQTGLQIGATGGSATIDATIIGNTMRQPGTIAGGAFGGIWAYAGAGAGDTNVLNIQIGDKNTTANKNTLTGSDPNNADDIFFGSGTASSSALNLSKAGSSSTTVAGVLIDCNVFGGDTWQYAGDGASTFNVVSTTPAAPPLLFAAGGVERAAEAVASTAEVAALPVATRSTVSGLAPELTVGLQVAVTPGVLSQAELDAVVSSAIARWEATGLTPEQTARLHRMSFEATTLATDRLGEAGQDVIRVDARAGGNGWFTDATPQSDVLFGRDQSTTRSYTDSAAAPAGRIDLLTTILHEMGHALGLRDTYRLQDRDSVMYGYLTKGERRLPAKDQAKGAVPFADNATHFLTNAPVDVINNPTGIDTLINPLTIGTLPAGKSVVITYSVTVETPIVGATQLSSQATVHSNTANFSDVTSTDVAGAVPTGSGPTVTILAVPPTVTSSTVNLAQNAPSLLIAGTFFDTTAANNTVTFSSGAVGTVTAATATQLTVSFTTAPTLLGALTAVVTTPDGNSGSAVQVATVVAAPVVTLATTSLNINNSTVVINGSNFSTTPGNNTVVFNDGAVGTVTSATATQLTVTLSTQPTAVGNLTANVTVFGGASGAVQVATVVPVVTQNTGNLAANASSISISGFGFNSNPLNDGVTFSGAGAGSGVVSAASGTGLSSSLPSGMVAGVLNAVVSSSGFSSTPAVQVATITPVVTSSTTSLAANATSVTFSGFGFDPVAANNSVTFNDGAVGTVTSATNTSLTVTFSTAPTSAGVLTAVVTTNSVGSGAAVQVATVIPVVTSNTATIQTTASTLTINGFGFASSNANNSVFLSSGTGTVTSSSPTQIVVTFSTAPSVGSLTATVGSNTYSSGAAVQVATVIALSITPSTANLVQSTTTLNIAGTGFSTTAANNTVTFNNGAIGTVTTATATQLTVTFSTQPTSLGALNATVAVSGVGSTGPTQVATVVAGAPAKLAFSQQPSNTVSGVAISPAITVQIQDANGFLTTDTSNVTLAIGTNAGSGTLSGTVTVAAVSGVATFTSLNIDKAGTGYTLAASSGALTGATSSTFNITAAAPAKLAVISQPSNTVSAVAISPAVTVQIQDAAGNLTTSTANVTLAIGTNPGSGTLSGTATVAAVSGTATFSTLNIDKAGTGYTLAASSGALTGATSNTFNITAAAPAKLAIIAQPSNTVSAVAISPAVTVQIQDAAGNLTTSTANVTMAIGTNPGSGTLSGTATVAAVSGVATFSTLNIDKAGTGYTLAASSGALTGATSSTFNITAAAPAKLAVISQPSNTVSAVAISPAVTVQIQDAAGNLTTSTANVILAIGTNPGSGTLSGTTTVAAVSGTATFSTLNIDKAGTGYTLAASSGALTGATSNTFNITAGAPAKLAVIAQPSNTVSAVAISPAVTVQIQDAAGNLTTSTSNVTLAIGTNPGSGTLSGTATVAAVGGTATFSTLNIDKAGTGYMLAASSGALTGATSNAFNITPGAPALLAVITQPSNSVAGVSISPAVTVQIQDAAGNLTTSTSNVTLAIGTNPGSGTLSGTTTVAAVSGTATFSTLSINKTGTGYTLAASSGALTGATSNTFNISPAAAATLALSAPGTASAGSAVTVTVTAKDIYGNTATGYGGTVQFTSSDANAVLPANSTLSSGTGNFNVTFENAGTQTVTGTDTVTSAITGTSGNVMVGESVAISATDATAVVGGVDTGIYRFTRGGNGAAVTVNFTLDGASTASSTEYTFSGASVSYSAGSGTVVIPNGSSTVDLTLSATANATGIAKPTKTVQLDVAAGSTYSVGSPANATVSIAQNGLVVFNTNDSGEGSLRQAVLNSTALGGTQAVTFDAAVSGTITLTSGELAISNNVSITGPEAGLTISGNNASRIFNIASGTVTMSRLVISSGFTTSLPTLVQGGAIFNSGTLTLVNCTISGSSASRTGGSSSIQGGAIFNSGTLNLISSTLSGNTAAGDGGSSSAKGGAIFSNGTLSLLNCTLSGNSASGSGGSATSFGGAIYSSGTLNVTLCTISGNSVLTSGSSTVGEGGGIYVASGSALLGDTIVAGNDAPDGGADVFGALNAGSSYNLIGDGSGMTGITNGTNGNQVGTSGTPINPMLGALANNGGLTQTMLLLSGSPAINAGSNALLPADTFDLDGNSNTAETLPVDQRGVGFPRVQGATVDIGAIEGLLFTPSLTAATTNEDTQTSSGLVITANSADAGGTTNYQITSITGGTLYKSDGTTVIASNDFITKTEGAAGLKFTPSADAFSPSTTFGFSVQASVTADSSGLKDSTVAASITVNPVADTPSVTGAATTMDTQSLSGLVITRNAVDGSEVAYFKISNIQHGTLYLNDGTTPISAGDFITVAQGGAGLKFTPTTSFIGVASFDVQGSIDNSGTGLSGTATASIAVGTVNPTPAQLVPTDPVTGNPLPPGSSYPVISQTGTLEVRVSIKNTTAFPINGFRLSVDYSAYLATLPSLRLYNSTSAPGVVPAYIDYPYPVAVGDTVSLKLQFYTSTRRLPNPFNPTLSVTKLSASQVSSTDGSGVQPRIYSLSNGRILLEWDSTPGHWYRVKYSSDLVNWYDSPVPVQAPANRTQWIDDGAPFTSAPPSSVPARYYRVNEISAPTP